MWHHLVQALLHILGYLRDALRKSESKEFDELDGLNVFPDFVVHGKQHLNQVDMMPRGLKHLAFHL